MTRAGWMIAAVTITAITVIARHISVGDAGVALHGQEQKMTTTPFADDVDAYIKPGARVLIAVRSGRVIHNTYTATVERLTKTQVVMVGGARFSRKTLVEVPAGHSIVWSSIHGPDETKEAHS